MGKKNIDKICFGKTYHETKEEALEHVDYILETEGLKLGVYKCPICTGWNLTSKGRK